MGETTTSEGMNPDADIDLTQFCRVFFDEAAENLERMEALLLAIDLESADDEELNSIFRCAHSVKGGAATFGFADAAEFTHEMETLLDKLRRRELAPTAPMIDTLLQAGDALRAQLARHQGAGGATVDTTGLQRRIRALTMGNATRSSTSLPAPAPDEIALLPGSGFTADAPVVLSDADDDLGCGFFDGAPGAPVADDSGPVIAQTAGLAPKEPPNAESSFAHAFVPAFAPARSSAPAAIEAPTLRVSIEKIDQLLNLVGELVITQAMLAQHSKLIDPVRYRQLAAALADLDRNTRDLQESVMSIRMIPMSLVFARFPRMLRDLAARLGKKVDFVTQGEVTELDKGLVEKITDPLTHLVRNSCDHGIESPATRLACGKPEHGTITLAASHQGGSVLIEVRDDGQGLSREKLLRKARGRGIDAPDSLTDPEVWNLIFAPGFSTAEVVTDVSGRGVGMDVVKKNITALGGSVEIDSAEGCGMSVKVRLPLTLAIMDGMSVGVGDEVYILPLSSVIESFQTQPDRIRTLGSNARVIEVRNEFMPILDLEHIFSVPRLDFENAGGILVVVEAGGGRVALQVDQLLGQHQVVVKNLEVNYRRVDDISGATILGDGRVALILDVASLVRRSRH